MLTITIYITINLVLFALSFCFKSEEKQKKTQASMDDIAQMVGKTKAAFLVVAAAAFLALPALIYVYIFPEEESR